MCNCTTNECPLVKLKSELGDKPVSLFVVTLLVDRYLNENTNSKISQRSLALSCIVKCVSTEPSVLSHLHSVLENAFTLVSDDPQLVSNALHLVAVAANIWNAEGIIN